jgi:hypothetical protein
VIYHRCYRHSSARHNRGEVHHCKRGLLPGCDHRPVEPKQYVLLDRALLPRPATRMCALCQKQTSDHPYSITSSARAMTVAGISRPMAFAVFRLIANSNVTGCAIGRSPALVPRKILSV